MVNTAFTVTIGYLCRSFFWIVCFFSVFVHWAKTFGLLSKTLRQGCNHCILRVHRHVLTKKRRIFRKMYKFYIMLGECKKNFGGVVNTAFTETIGPLFRSFFWNICFFNLFVHWAKRFRPFAKKFQGGCNHWVLHVQRNVLGKIEKGFFEKSINFIYFSESARKVSAGWSSLHLPRH